LIITGIEGGVAKFLDDDDGIDAHNNNAHASRDGREEGAGPGRWGAVELRGTKTRAARTAAATKHR
jgi:hypothetical protein